MTGRSLWEGEDIASEDVDVVQKVILLADFGSKKVHVGVPVFK